MKTSFEKTLDQIENNDPDITNLNLRAALVKGKINAERAKSLASALVNNTNIVTIILIDNKFGNEGAEYLANALENNTNITTLELGYNEIGAEGASFLSKAIENNTTLTTFELNGNPIADAGAKSIAKAMVKNKCIIAINLSRNKIGNEGAKYIAKALKKNANITILDLGRNKFDAVGVSYIADALEQNTRLNTLNLNSNKIDNEGINYLASALKQNKSLTTLDLESNTFTSEGVLNLAAALEINTTLTTLKLRDNDINETGAKYLANALEKNKGLVSLVLLYNFIGTKGAEHLAMALEKNTTLKTLNLSGNCIDDNGVPAIALALGKNKSLTSLSLGYNRIGHAGFQAIAVALEKNTTLNKLDLWANEPGDIGAQAIAMALKKNTTLTSLTLTENLPYCKIQIGKKGTKALAEALKTNYTLLKLKGLYNQEISTYLERNQAIAKILEPLYEYINTGRLLNDGQIIENCLKAIEDLFPNLRGLSNDSYPVEAHRLLTALGHHSCFSAEAKLDTLHTLLSPFKNQSFQQLADKTLGLLLVGDFSTVLKERKLEKEGLLLSLYAFRNHLHEPEIKRFVQIALFKLMSEENNVFNYKQKQDFEESTVLLTQYQLLSLLEQTHKQLETNKPGSYEEQLIKALVLSGANNEFSLSTACHSKTFLTVFKGQYPKAKSFTTMEHCLLTAFNKKTSFLMDTNQEPNQEIGEGEFVNYTMQLIHDKTNSAFEVHDLLRQTLEINFPPELEEYVEEIEPGIQDQNIEAYPSYKERKKLIEDGHYEVLFKIPFSELRSNEQNIVKQNGYKYENEDNFHPLTSKGLEIIKLIKSTRSKLEFIKNNSSYFSGREDEQKRTYNNHLSKWNSLLDGLHELTSDLNKDQINGYFSIAKNGIAPIGFMELPEDSFPLQQKAAKGGVDEKDKNLKSTVHDKVEGKLSEKSMKSSSKRNKPESNSTSSGTTQSRATSNKGQEQQSNNPTQSQKKNTNIETAIHAINQQNTKPEKQNTIVEFIQNNRLSVDELNTLYNNLRDTEVLNEHRNPKTDSFFGIKNTTSWQHTLGKLRSKALEALFKKVDAETTKEGKLILLAKAKTFPLFQEHRSNSIFAGAWGRTASVAKIEEKEEELVRDGQTHWYCSIWCI